MSEANVDLQSLLDLPPRPRLGAPRQFDPDVADARAKERSRRRGRAQSLAYMALARLHAELYRQLYEQAVVKVNAECGPLPGDEAAS